MNMENNSDFIGYFIQRANINSILVDDFIRELENNLFELKIMHETILHFQSQQLLSFDALVGDWKCQTRASMLIDLADKQQIINETLSQEFITITDILDKTEQILHQIKNFSHIQRQEFRQSLKGRYVLDVMKEYNLDYIPSPELKFLSLCFSLTFKNLNLPVFLENKVSTNKMKFLINTIKKILCNLSIKYEQNTTTTYGSKDEQIAIQQIECQHVQQMTALFVGFRSIFKKMEDKKQPFLLHSTIFCACGGIQKTELKQFNFINNDWKQVPISQDLSQAAMIIQTYQFPGSLADLQNILGENSPHDPSLGFEAKYLYVCSCTKPTIHKTIDSMKEALMAFFAQHHRLLTDGSIIKTEIMAFFAQHAQFTNGAPINFEGLGLMNSDLKKDYDYLLTLPGFNIHDMSQLWIRHMYAATLKEALGDFQQQQKILNITI